MMALGGLETVGSTRVSFDRLAFVSVEVTSSLLQSRDDARTRSTACRRRLVYLPDKHVFKRCSRNL